MSNEPLVSIITPTYNRARFLGIAIDSVLAQTYENWELVIVDDGSTDNTPEIMEPYLKDSRIRYFRQENQGQSVARNVGIRESKGEYICFLDSDNAWLPDKLRRSVELMEQHQNVGVLYADVITVDEDGKEISRKNMRRFSGRIAPQMLRDNCVSMNTTIARRRCFEEQGGFSESYRVADDYELWLRLSAHYEFLYVPEFFAHYRVMNDQISSDKTRRFQANERILQDFVSRNGHTLSKKDIQSGLCAFYTRRGRYFASNGAVGVALRSYGKAIVCDPVSVKPWRALAKLVLKRTG
ncbi:glycosyltransferase involved in cell wall biosynthesis [Natronocella acetinitrilica]|uniref:Glycosyltransferase involved in cell wall biosynthesis n=1 Tax=Natronocella acetinitrilica TaxID=414046 RepID=A0AAE3G811_9GAMM|nr:glycosyltransferase [Natronocella acetinitrilica]MCP1677147.1 glycosyltransferase involved in cell wall biosynthesis [Natronocella acetinitrilica]